MSNRERLAGQLPHLPPCHDSDSRHDAASCETCRFSAILRRGMQLAILLIVVAYLLYITATVPPWIPFDDLPRYWQLSAAEYVEQTGQPGVWTWFGRLHQGEALTLLPAILLVMLGFIGVLAVLPIYMRRGQRTMTIILLLQLIIIIWAAVPWGTLRS
jgi:hypothetical protein